ncbi:hypothetical protein ETAA8_18620 [Anatilimnocola aggregata]|uniref:Uncharacterized protein n=1 Tax=Anatilimnocola aggregata TaxID=2528021 RepID=A0A517Y978_9BACT|nr:hypothetical protein ETAA8_18620 [Anatilimnocola aggregata]
MELKFVFLSASVRRLELWLIVGQEPIPGNDLHPNPFHPLSLSPCLPFASIVPNPEKSLLSSKSANGRADIHCC